jgi:hypothetical protein
MYSSFLLDTAVWDLLVDANGNMAVASEPYSLAQDAASAIQTYLGEYYWDITVGVPWLTQILGQSPSLALLKAQLAETAVGANPDIASATVFISSFNNRVVTGQVQIVSAAGQTAAANFGVVNLQGSG